MTHELTLDQLHDQYLSALICRVALERVAPLYPLPALDRRVNEARQAETRCWQEYQDALQRVKADIDAFMSTLDRQEQTA